MIPSVPMSVALVERGEAACAAGDAASAADEEPPPQRPPRAGRVAADEEPPPRARCEGGASGSDAPRTRTARTSTHTIRHEQAPTFHTISLFWVRTPPSWARQHSARCFSFVMLACPRSISCRPARDRGPWCGKSLVARAQPVGRPTPNQCLTCPRIRVTTTPILTPRRGPHGGRFGRPGDQFRADDRQSGDRPIWVAVRAIYPS
jgi:hypothetical protein